MVQTDNTTHHGKFGLRKKALFSLTIFLGVILLVELSARAYQFSRNRTFEDALFGTMYRDYFFLGPSFKPGIGDWQDIPDLNINRFGFRGEEFEIKKRPNEFRIITFGGSTSHSGNYPGKLYDVLKEKDDSQRTFRLINAAVPTWNTTQSLIQFITRAIYLDPDLIIVYHAINDTNQKYDKWLTNLPEVDYTRFNGFLEKNLLSYVFIRNRIRKLYNDTSLILWNYFYHANNSDATVRDDYANDENENDETKMFRTNIENFIALSHARGIKVVLVTMPLNFNAKAPLSENRKRAGAFYSFNARFLELVDGTNRNNDVIRSLVNGTDVILVDAASTDFGLHEQYFRDLCHFSEEGGRAFATMIEVALEPIILATD